MKVELFVPCFIDQFNPETGFNMIKVLEKAGCKVSYNLEQTCCGLPAFNAGLWEDAREVGEKLLNETATDKNLICGAGACTHMIRNSYDLLFQNSSFHNKYRQLQKKTFELSEFLVDVLQFTDFGATLNANACFLPGCVGKNNCNIQQQPLQLLKNVQGLNLLSLNFDNECCGFGGMFAVNNSQLSIHMGKSMLQNITEAGAEVIISTDYSCLLHLNAVAKANNFNVKVMHIADVLANF